MGLLKVLWLLSLTIPAFSQGLCPKGTLPTYRCKAIKSDDDIYRLLQFDLLVCQGKVRAELVSINGIGKVERMNAMVKPGKDKLRIIWLDEVGPVGTLTVNRLNLRESSFQIHGDEGFKQQRICVEIK